MDSHHKRRKLLEAIQKAAQSGSVELDLSGQEIAELPEEIGQLGHLRVLDLSNNGLTKLPDAIRELAQLETLNLSSNRLSEVPIAVCELPRLETLDVSTNCLTSIPQAIEQLQQLTKLHLAQNELENIPKAIGKLTRLTRLSLDQNKLTFIPIELGQLVNLSELFVAHNQLTQIPQQLGKLGQLVVLYLYQNQLTEIPDQIGELRALQELYLHENKLTEIPKTLGQLTELRELYLDRNRLTAIPKELKGLASLTELCLNQNQLTFIPKQLGELSELIDLDLSHNKLTRLPSELGQLHSLMKLSLDYNRLTAIPREFYRRGELSDLTVSHNQLSEVHKEISRLQNLQVLDLSNNYLTILPSALEQLPRLKRLRLHNNDGLAIPNEILSDTPTEILSYYFQAKEQSQPLNEAKLIVVGYGEVGKTSLVSRLVNQRFDSGAEKTEGIQISPWTIQVGDSEDITLNVWDFGGQEIMHSTHQFFLTERSLYLLVLSGRQDHEDTDAEYWLELIRSFGGNSPIIVVLNKIDEHPFDVNRRDLENKSCSSIKDFVKTDCATARGIDQLTAVIKREVDQLDDLRAPFPSGWMRIKNTLANMDESHIPYGQYREICKECGEPDEDRQDQLASHLHNLGVAFNYRKFSRRLRDPHILKPDWVTKGIYALINSRILAETRGELDVARITEILDSRDYPEDCHDFLIELMRRFKLCFRFQEDENRYLIPDLLDKQQPDTASRFNLTECLNFKYEYSSLPKGMLPQFIVRTHILSDQTLRWRTGVILTFEENLALVKADHIDRSITISVSGKADGQRRLLAVIRADFERIHSNFQFTVHPLVPIPDRPTEYIRYRELVAYERANRPTYPYFDNDGSIRDLDVQSLLNGVDIEGSRQESSSVEEPDTSLKLFYSYSRKDEQFREQLDTHLKILERQRLIQPWYDDYVVPGEDWQEEINENLGNADIVLLLVSSDFLASEHCRAEWEIAMERHRQGKTTVVPIHIRSTATEGVSFHHLQRLPTGNDPIALCSDRDKAWMNVERGIRKVIEEIRSRR